MKQLMALIPLLLAYRYVGVFALNYLTSVIVPLPGATILLIIGSLAHRGYINLPLAFVAAFAATVCGDLTAYWSTRIFGTPERLARYRKNNRAFRVMERYIGAHPFATIFISRFVGFSTTAANFIAGFVDMPLRTFLIADAVANALCVSLYLGLGYTVGRLWSHASLLLLTGIVILISAALYGLIMVAIYVFGDHKPDDAADETPAHSYKLTPQAVQGAPDGAPPPTRALRRENRDRFNDPTTNDTAPSIERPPTAESGPSPPAQPREGGDPAD
jgi:membrane protein DedA with SNARE-associated domain